MKALFLVVALSSAAPADEVELQSGVVIEGKVVDLGDSIKVTRGAGSVTYPKSMVRRITPKKTPEEIYAEKAAEIKDGDADGRLRLARWCVAQKLSREALAEYRKAVAARPDDEEARVGAGYVKVDGTWLTEDEAAAAKGLLKHKGKWVTPQQRDLDLALDEEKELDKALSQEVEKQLSKLRSADEKKREEAATALARIDDKYKSKAYVAALGSPSRDVRKLAFQELGRMKDVSALKPLVRRSLWDEDESLRPVAFRAVQDIGHPDAALFYVPFLAEESVSARGRAVDALAQFKDPRTAAYLVEALDNNIDLVKSFEQTNEQLTAVVGRVVVTPDGGRMTLPRVAKLKADGLDKESRAKLMSERSLIVGALASVTGVDLGEDVARWRAWLAQRKPAKSP